MTKSQQAEAELVEIVLAGTLRVIWICAACDRWWYRDNQERCLHCGQPVVKGYTNAL
jgi:rubrerythrin